MAKGAEMQFYLGLDGGGSGCRAVLSDPDGRVLGRGEAGPANIHSDREGALAAIRAASQQALGAHDPQQVAACLGLAGANMAGARDWLAPLLPFGRLRVVHDAETALVGALGAGGGQGLADGIVAAIGTGSVFSRRLAGESLTIGGWGPVLGDEAGGAWMGRFLLTLVLRSQDGLIAPTPLGAQILAQMGGAAAIVGFARSAKAADFAAAARQMLEYPGDPLAETVLNAACDYVTQAITRLQPAHPMPVIFTGGLGPIFADRLFDLWDQRPARGTPLDGALLLAMQPDHASPDRGKGRDGP